MTASTAMPQGLTSDQAAAYARDGYLAPVRAFTAEEALGYRKLLESAERAQGGLVPDRRRKMHLYLRWVDDIVRDPRVLDAVESLIGPDILVYTLTCWIKEPQTDAFISWHQDSTYFGLDPAEHVTAWVALSPSSSDSGCVQVVPGSHATGQMPHATGQGQQNMLGVGQQLEIARDARIELMELQPGEFSLHHTFLHHNSMPNRSDDRRIGLGISYIPTRCRCESRVRLSASLVRGIDRYGHFDLDPAPMADLDPRALRTHEAAMKRWHEAREELIAQAMQKAA